MYVSYIHLIEDKIVAKLIINYLTSLEFTFDRIKDQVECGSEWPTDLRFTCNADYKSSVPFKNLTHLMFTLKNGVYIGKPAGMGLPIDPIKAVKRFPTIEVSTKDVTRAVVKLNLGGNTISSTFIKGRPDKVKDCLMSFSLNCWKFLSRNYHICHDYRVYLQYEIKIGIQRDDLIECSFLDEIITKGKLEKPNGNGLGVTTYEVLKEIIIDKDVDVDIPNLGVLIKKEKTWFNGSKKSEVEYLIVSALGVVMVYEGLNPDFTTPSKLVYIGLV